MEEFVYDFINIIQQFLKDNVPIISLMTFFLGLFLGNRLSIGRDKRKEFNAIAEPIRVILFKEKQNPTPYTKGIDDIDIFKLRELLPLWRRVGFDITVKRYRENKSEKNTVTKSPGVVYFINTEKVINNIETLLKFTKKK